MDIDEDAVAIGQAVLAQGTGTLEQLRQRLAFGTGADGLGRQARIFRRDAGDVVVAGLHALDPEADMVHARRRDAGAGVIVYRPGHDDECHRPVAQIVIGIAVGAVAGLQLENAGVEFRHRLGAQRAQGEMIDVARIARAVVLDINVAAVRHVLLRDVEDIAVRIVGAEAREGAVGRAVEPLHLGIMRREAPEHGLDILDLDAEMVESGRASGPARIDVEAGIAVAQRASARRAVLARWRHGEHRLVELRELGVVLADDGDVVELGEHARPLFGGKPIGKPRGGQRRGGCAIHIATRPGRFRVAVRRQFVLCLLMLFGEEAAAQTVSESILRCTDFAAEAEARIAACTAALESGRVPDRLPLLVTRAGLYGGAGRFELALADYDEAIGLDPEEASLRFFRAALHDNRGHYALAAAGYGAAIRIDPDFAVAYNNLAWLLSTAPDSGVRDGAAAIELAGKALALRDVASYRDTLAAAYAEAGDFARAVAEQRRALRELPEDGSQGTVEDYQSRLDLYLMGMPYRRVEAEQ